MKKPNILVYFVDDMGYGDVSFLNENSKINTANIDEFAKDSIVFRDAHSSSAVCTPSRYSLLTGKYNWRTEKQMGICDIFEGPMIKNGTKTIAELLKENGYNTAHIGKWHLGMEWGFEADGDFFQTRANAHIRPNIDDALLKKWDDAFSKPIKDGANEHGFDYTYGVDVPNWPPYVYIENHNVVKVPTEWTKDEMHSTLLAAGSGPICDDYKFDEVFENITVRAEKYIEDNANKDKPFFMYFAATTPHTPLTPHKNFAGKSGLNSPYADLVLETDASFGRLLSKLKECGVEDDTLVIFASDNGFAPYVGLEELEAQGHFPSYIYRGFKFQAWDGGHRIPFFMHWKNGGLETKTIDNLVCLTDVFATISGITGCEYDNDTAQDSFDLMKLINDGDYERDFCVHHSSRGVFAIRTSDRKLILSPEGNFYPGEKETKPYWQLYDMINDPEEQNNLIHKEPETVKKLMAILQKAVDDGRTTKGKKLKNDIEVDIWKTSKDFDINLEELYGA